MSPERARRWFAQHMTLTKQVALLSLVPVVALGFILTRVLEGQVVDSSVHDASQSARLIAQIGIQPRLSPQVMLRGLDARGVAELDEQLRARSATRDLARIKIWNDRHTVIYSDDHRLIGRTLPASDELENALAGRANDAAVVDPKPRSETAGEVGLGRLVEVYVPLRFKRSGTPSGAFEIYLSYRPIAAALAGDKRTIALVVAIGLALLWAILFRIVARASRRLTRQSRENYRLARFDRLTGLPNRTLFHERVSAALARPPAGDQAVAVLVIDVDGFKQVNNTLGDKTGDRVLRDVGRRLERDVPDSVLVSRLGADEYALLSPRTDGEAAALALARTVQESFEAPIELDGIALNVEVSIGIAIAGERQERSYALLQQAASALTRARAHRTRVEVYSPAHDSFDPGRLMLLGQVRGALALEEFELHYQPKMELKDGRIFGVEALLRWRHPDRGLLMPLSFVHLVEQTALIGPLTDRVVDLALGQLVSWRLRGLELEMSVNLSARNLLEPELPQRIRALLHKHQVAPDRLTLEVTESATMSEPERATQVLQALRGTGVRVSIDDFGTGNASIAYLARLPATEVKIDKSFVTGICEDARADAITRSTVDLARRLGLHVVAEGIETQAVLERLLEVGCDSGQGFHISEPLPAEELAERLLAQPQRGAPAAVAKRRAVSLSGARR
jgi:diguanylate cyclase (GGDEF)-like protein